MKDNELQRIEKEKRSLDSIKNALTVREKRLSHVVDEAVRKTRTEEQENLMLLVLFFVYLFHLKSDEGFDLNKKYMKCCVYLGF